jgi:hypothetical protein
MLLCDELYVCTLHCLQDLRPIPIGPASQFVPRDSRVLFYQSVDVVVQLNQLGIGLSNLTGFLFDSFIDLPGPKSMLAGYASVPASPQLGLHYAGLLMTLL